MYPKYKYIEYDFHKTFFKNGKSNKKKKVLLLCIKCTFIYLNLFLIRNFRSQSNAIEKWRLWETFSVFNHFSNKYNCLIIVILSKGHKRRRVQLVQEKTRTNL